MTPTLAHALPRPFPRSIDLSRAEQWRNDALRAPDARTPRVGPTRTFHFSGGDVLKYIEADEA